MNGVSYSILMIYIGSQTKQVFDSVKSIKRSGIYELNY
jgi:hypothetical protein